MSRRATSRRTTTAAAASAGDYVRAEAADGSGREQRQLLDARGGRRARPGCRCSSGRATRSVPRTKWSSTGSARSTPRGPASRRHRPSRGTRASSINAGTGCAPADYASAPAGDWIAIVTGSNLGCQNVEKARQASTAGAEALIVALNSAGDAPILTGSLVGCSADDPGRQHHAGGREHDPRRDRRRNDDRNGAQASESSRHP